MGGCCSSHPSDGKTNEADKENAEMFLKRNAGMAAMLRVESG